MDQITTVISNLCENHLANCQTGQLEGLQYTYMEYCQAKSGGSEDKFKSDIILTAIAEAKERAFTRSVITDRGENVHDVSKYRSFFGDKLGIASGEKDFYLSVQKKKPVASHTEIYSIRL